MSISYTLNIWDVGISALGIGITIITSYRIYKLSTNLTWLQKFEKEKIISEKILSFGTYKNIILANVKKYSDNSKNDNTDYHKQGAEFYNIIPNVGLSFILRPEDETYIPLGIIPFEWIEYIRDYDSEDNKPIVVCKFKGKKYYKNFKSPFKEIQKLYKNTTYKNGDPLIMKYRHY